MKTRKLGSLEVSEMGLGCMGMSEFYGPTNDITSLQVLHKAFDLGVDHFDTSDMYGNGHNETLLSKFLQGKRSKINIATKFGIRRQNGIRTIDNSPLYIKAACEASLKRLNIDYIDLYYVHRLDRTLPIEDTIVQLSKLVTEGKIRHLGLCEVSPEELEKAHQIHPISAVQTEYSLISRGPEDNGLFKTCEMLNVGFVAYSPLGRGLLTGKIRSTTQLNPQDYRNTAPRFQDKNLQNNIRLVDELTKMAKALNCTPTQLALAWVLHSKPFICPIPGTRSIQRLEENLGGLQVHIPSEILSELNKLFSADNIQGERYPTIGMKEVY